MLTELERELERFREGELAQGDKTVKLLNVSYHPPPSLPLIQRPIQMFSHVDVEGTLELKRQGPRILATPTITSVGHSMDDKEKVRRTIEAAFDTSIEQARHYHPGQRVSLYSPDWSFHCSLEEENNPKSD